MNFDLHFYSKILIRRLPVMMALFLVCAGIGLAMAARLPDVYSTSAKLLVEAPQIPQSMASSTIRTGAGEQLQVIQQRLMTRANLIDIANRFDAFPNIQLLEPDEVVEEMRKATKIRRTGGRDQATIMTVSFKAESPTAAANVVNEYVTLILDASARFRLDRAKGTLDFFEQEVERLSSEINTQSAKIIEFKNTNKDALPDDLGYRQNRQSNFQERLARLERDYAAAIEQRKQIVDLFERTGRLQSNAPPQKSPDAQQLERLLRELDQALLIYSDTNPRVRVLQNRISLLQEKVSAEAGVENAEDVQQTQQQALLEITLSELDTRIADLTRSIEDVTTELDELRISIQATPSNAIALGSLQRDYANTQALYNAAVNNLSDAQMGERIEVTSKGQRVTVIESANVPSQPSGPDRKKVIALGIGAGLGLAGGFFALLELLNRSIRRPIDLTNRFGITPLATIPFMESKTRRRVRRSALVLASLAVLVGVPAGLWVLDTQYMPLELLITKVADRIGFS